MFKQIQFFILLTFFINPAILSAQPVLEWSVDAGTSGGSVAPPLLLDAYTAPGEEIFVSIPSAAGSRFYVLRANGNGALFDGSSFINFEDVIKSSATGALFPNDQTKRIVFGSSGGVHVLSYNGMMINADTPNEISSNPVLEDIDDDQEEEIIAVDDSGIVYAWDLTAYSLNLVSGFPVSLGESVDLMSPAVADINGVDFPEIAIVTEDSAYVLDRFGNRLNNWPVSFASSFSTSPVIGKLDDWGDETKNIVFAADNGWIFITRFNGAFCQQINLYANIDTAPILADLDLDGNLEIIICTVNSQVHALKFDGSYVPGWPVDLSEYTGSLLRAVNETRCNNLFANPLVADIDGDFMLEVLVPIAEDAILAVLTANGELEYDPVVMGIDIEEPFEYHSNFRASPAVSDIDFDGQVELVISTSGDFQSASRIKCYEFGPVTDNQNQNQRPWPLSRQNVRGTGVMLNETESETLPPSCNFPDIFSFSPDSELIIDFSIYAGDGNSSPTEWTCSLNGLQQLQINLSDNHTAHISSNDNWVGIETALATVIDPDNLLCNSTFQIICGQKGDVNSDGNVTEDDVPALVSVLLGFGNLDDDYQRWAADVNADQAIDLQDLLDIVTSLVPSQ